MRTSHREGITGHMYVFGVYQVLDKKANIGDVFTLQYL